MREQCLLCGRDALHGDDRAPLLGGAPRRPRRRLGRLQQRRAEEPLPMHRLRLQVEQKLGFSPLIAFRGLPLNTYALRGRGGVGPNADVVLRLSKQGCVNLRTRGGRGVKKAEKSAYVLNGSPLMRNCQNSLK